MAQPESSEDSILPDHYIIELLAGSNVFSPPGTKDELYFTAEFQILKILGDHPGIELDSLVNQVDTVSLIRNLIANLMRHNLIVRADEQLLLNLTLLKISPGKLVEEEIIEVSEEPKVEEELKVVEEPIVETESALEAETNVVDTATELGFSSNRSRLMEQRRTKEVAPDTNDTDFDALFDEVLEESIEDFMADFEELYVAKKKGDSPAIIPSIIDLLKDNGYYDNDFDNDLCAKGAPYQLMVGILENNPISTEDLEKVVKINMSISMELSNLKSDDLIVQTNDYQWTLSKKTLKVLKSYLATKKLEKPTAEEDPDEAILWEYITGEVSQFFTGMLEMGYVFEKGGTMADYADKAEVEVLLLIRDNDPISEEDIRNKAVHTLPVIVKRMISKLTADNAITKLSDGKYTISNKFKFRMIKNVLKEELDDDRYQELNQKFNR